MKWQPYDQPVQNTSDGGPWDGEDNVPFMYSRLQVPSMCTTPEGWHRVHVIRSHKGKQVQSDKGVIH
jgi:hypothetical protein